jgi:TRAP-type mannitol/chloroaromatic compound transport system substrate-binding protein
VADIKGLKCRQTGLNAEVYTKMGMSVVNMAGGEIVPSAQRGVIDCAEWVGGVEDLRLGLHSVFKYHYTPGMHENNSIGELGFNLDVWKSLSAPQQDAVNSAVNDTFIQWLTRWQKQNADAMEELVKKHGVQIRRTPPDILLASLKAWDEVAAENSAKSPTFKKVYESQRAYAAKVVPSKRYMFPPYSFAANYYWPQENAKPAAGKKAAP